MKGNDIEPPYLGELARERGLNFGGAVTVKFLDVDLARANNMVFDKELTYENDTRYQETIIREFNMIVHEVEMLYKYIHPERERYDFTLPGKIVEFGLQNGLKIRGGPQLIHDTLHLAPEWIHNEIKSKDEAIDMLEGHVRTTIGHFKGKIHEWDVVNEAMVRTAPKIFQFRHNGWYDLIGPEYVDLTYSIAHEVDPRMKLFLNEAFLDQSNRRFKAFYDYLDQLLNKGVPIDAVGIQRIYS